MRSIIQIEHARLLSNGANGGFRYLAGRCRWDGQSVRVFAFMRDKSLEKQLIGLDLSALTVLYDRHDYIPSIGLSLWDCQLQIDC